MLEKQQVFTLVLHIILTRPDTEVTGNASEK